MITSQAVYSKVLKVLYGNLAQRRVYVHADALRYGFHRLGSRRAAAAAASGLDRQPGHGVRYAFPACLLFCVCVSDSLYVLRAANSNRPDCQSFLLSMLWCLALCIKATACCSASP